MAMDGSVTGNAVVDGGVEGVAEHPSRLAPQEIADDMAYLQALAHLTLRHTRCSKRCLRGTRGSRVKKCRYKFPRTLRDTTLVQRLAMFDWLIETMCNDCLMGSYNPQIAGVWRSNVDVKVIVSTIKLILYLIKYTAKGELRSEHLEAIEKFLAGGEDGAQQQHPRQDSGKRVLQQILMGQISSRDYSIQEALHLLLQLVMYRCSRSFVYVQTGNTRLIERSGTCRTSIDRYKERPADDEAINRMTMYEFFSRCEALPFPRRGYRIREAGREAILIVNPKLHSNEASEERREQYYRQQVLLYSCWRDEEQAKGSSNSTWREAFEAMPRDACPLRIRDFGDIQADNEVIGESDSVESELPDIADTHAESVGEAGRFDRQQDNWMGLLGNRQANIEQSKRPEDQFRAAPDNYDWGVSGRSLPSVEEAREVLNLLSGGERSAEAVEEEQDGSDPVCAADIDLSGLNARQREMYDLVARHFGSRVTEPLRVIIYGSAGTGKSYLIAAVVRLLGECCKVLAPTGVAAFNIRGQTVHSALKVGTMGRFCDLLSGSPSLNSLQREWAQVRYVIVDEFSMVGQALLGKLDARLRQAFPQRCNQWFGGLSVILVGDVFQLAPVMDTVLYVPSRNTGDEIKRRGYLAYQEFKTVVHLNQLVRQAEDARFAAMLQSVRMGQANEEDWRLLMKFRTMGPDVMPSGFENCTHLYATNAQVHEENCHRLSLLMSDANPICRLAAVCRGGNSSCSYAAAAAAGSAAGDKGESESGLWKQIYLAVGARVMLTRNLSVTHGLVNGSTGTVRGFSFAENVSPPQLPECVWVEFDNYKGPGLPDGTTGGAAAGTRPRLVPIFPMTSTWLDGAVNMSRVQVPLKLAWAITIHKSQGLTIGKAYVDLGCKAKQQAGLFYTAISRVRRLDDLRVSGCDFAHYQRLCDPNSVQAKVREQDRLLGMCVRGRES